MTRQSLTETLSARLVRPVDRRARQRAQRHLLDWLACACGGLNTEQGQALLRWADQYGLAGNYFTVGSTGLARDSALFVNAGLANVLEMDDLHRTAILHPGPVVMPVVVAVAQQYSLGTRAVLDAIVVGYEAMIRVGRSFGTGHYRFWHNTATAGSFGAAAAAVRALGGNKRALAHALGHAGTQSAGLWQTRHEPSMSKQLHTGRAAHAGVIAAELAMSGFTAPMQILEGEQGVYAAMCPDASPGQVVSEESDWLIHDVSFKPWPACRHAHAAIDAALLMQSQLADAGYGWRDVRAAQVHSYEQAIQFCDNALPDTDVSARFSLQHAVAVCLVRGAPALGDFDATSRQDESIAALRARVNVSTDGALSAAFPLRYGAALSVTLDNGQRYEFSCPDALGDPDKPVSAGQLDRKHADLLAWGGLLPAEAGGLTGGLTSMDPDDSTGGEHAPWWQVLASIQWPAKQESVC